MAKLLDIDALDAPVRQIKMGGRVLDLAPRTFGALRRYRTAARAAMGVGEEEQGAAILKLIQAVIPAADEAIADLFDTEGRLLDQILKHWSGQEDDEAAALAQDPPSPG